MKRYSIGMAIMASALLFVGAGVSAVFTDQGTATETIKVGEFGIELSSAQGVVSPDGHSITYDAPDILASDAGSAPFVFDVENIGSVPVVLHVTANDPGAPFTDILGAPADVTLAANESHTYNAGLQWPELGAGDMNATHSITYTIVASEA